MFSMKEDKRILVIGDVMLDIYIQGTAKRLSPEAPCVVLSECETPMYRLGGAANVAYQLSETNSVWICGNVGDDMYGNKLSNLSKNENIGTKFLYTKQIKTTTKKRYLSENNHQLLRVDDDAYSSLTNTDVAEICSSINNGSFDAVVLSDYAKGILSENVCQEVINSCNLIGIPSVVDIKDIPYNRYKGATLIKGNEKEFSDLSKLLWLNINEPANALKLISEYLRCQYVVMTLGKRGISGYSHSSGYVNISATDIPIHDVTGAGDVVTSFITMLLLDGVKFDKILHFSNKAAQLKVSRVGTSRISYNEVIEGNTKLICDVHHIDCVRQGKTVVFTNGCFDVLHAGHVDMLKKAKEDGDILIVGLNSDSSIFGIKGPNRPINSFENRANVLAALEVVDYIIGFEEPTPYNLIKQLNPDVLVKGGDYSIEEIVGADLVRDNGGKVITIPITIPTSSTNILKMMNYE